MNEVLKVICFSPRRLATAVVAFVAVLGIVAYLLGGSSSAPPEPPRSAPLPALTEQAATTAARAWVDARMTSRPDQTPAQWLAGVAALSTPDMAASLSTVDPTQLPQTGAYGSPTVRELNPTFAVVAVKVVGSDAILVTVVQRDGRALVSGATLPRVSGPVDW